MTITAKAFAAGILKAKDSGATDDDIDAHLTRLREQVDARQDKVAERDRLIARLNSLGATEASQTVTLAGLIPMPQHADTAAQQAKEDVCDAVVDVRELDPMDVWTRLMVGWPRERLAAAFIAACAAHTPDAPLHTRWRELETSW